MNCPHCGSINKDNANFCTKCGAPIPHEKVCPKCHAKADPSALFCSACGCALSKMPNGKDALIKGDRNMVAGNVIGENYSVEKGGTFIQNQDETRRLVKCHICGTHIAAAGSITCPGCGEITCETCYNRDVGLCRTCMEDEYRHAFLNARKDRDGWKFLSPGSAAELEKMRELYRLTENRVSELRKEVIGSECDQADMGNVDFAIFEDGRMEDAYREIGNHQRRNPYHTAVLSRLLYVAMNLAATDSGNLSAAGEAGRVFDLAFQGGNESLDIYLVLIDQALNGQPFPAGIRDRLKKTFGGKDPGDPAFAGDLLDAARKIWPGSVRLKYRSIFYLKKLYAEYGNPKDRKQAQSELAGLDGDPRDLSVMDRSWLEKVRAFGDRSFDPTPDYCVEHDLYYFILNPWSSAAYHKKAKSIDTNVKPQRREYFKLLEIAATRFPDPSPEALTDLADCYARGIGTEANVQKGLEYYQKAAAALGVKIKFRGTAFTSYQDSGARTEYAVPPGITEIAPGAFAGASLKTVAIPGTVTKLEADFPPDCTVLFAGDTPVPASSCRFDGVSFDVPETAGLKTVAFRFRKLVRGAKDSVKWCHEAVTGQCGRRCESCLFCSNHGFGELKMLAFLHFCRENDVSLPSVPTSLNPLDIILAVVEKYRSGAGGVKRDPAKAVRWCRMAAEQGNAGAQFTLGRCYETSDGVEKDAAEAVKWYRAAAEQGLVDAQLELARCYETGVGVAKDGVEAANWYGKAAEQGNAEAQFRFGEYSFSLIDKKTLGFKAAGSSAEDDFIAEERPRNAAKQDDEEMEKYWIGDVSYSLNYASSEEESESSKSDGSSALSDRNAVEAAKWYSKAARQGHAQAQFRLAGCYLDGIGVAGNMADAVKWYRLAAGQGVASARSLYLFGEASFNGTECKKNYADAIGWYAKAVEQRRDDDRPAPFDPVFLARRLLTIVSDESLPKADADAALTLLTKLSCWDRFAGGDWTDLLLQHPEYAKCCGLTADSEAVYWSSLDSSQWKTLADRHPRFQMFLDLRSGIHVVRHLKEQPDSGRFCDWSHVSTKEWIALLKEKELIESQLKLNPGLLQLCPWEKFTGKDWVGLLSARPEYAACCKWDRLDGEDWVELLSARPEYAVRCKWDKLGDREFEALRPYADRLWSHIGKGVPPLAAVEKMHWGRNLNWSEVVTSGGRWCKVLLKHPGLAEFCDWSLLTPADWMNLLAVRPQYGNRCTIWEKFKKDDWLRLLTLHPEFEKKCPAEMWAGFDKDEWIGLLAEHPEFEKKCPAGIWKELSSSEWKRLLPGHPSYGDHIPSGILFAWKKEKAWNIIKEAVCYVFDDGAQGCIPIIVLLVFTIVSLQGETGWLALFSHSPKHALISGAVWIAAATLCFFGLGVIWYDFISNRLVYLWHSAFTFFSLYTFFHWSFFFSRWSWGLVVCLIVSFLLFFFPVVETGQSNCGLRFFSVFYIPYFTVFSWIVLSPVRCSGWLIFCFVLLFILLFLLGLSFLDASNPPGNDDLRCFAVLGISAIAPLIIGIWFFLSPVSTSACYKMADSLRSSFPRAAQELVRKGHSADPEFKSILDLSFESDDDSIE